MCTNLTRGCSIRIACLSQKREHLFQISNNPKKPNLNLAVNLKVSKPRGLKQWKIIVPKRMRAKELRLSPRNYRLSWLNQLVLLKLCNLIRILSRWSKVKYFVATAVNK